MYNILSFLLHRISTGVVNGKCNGPLHYAVFLRAFSIFPQSRLYSTVVAMANHVQSGDIDIGKNCDSSEQKLIMVLHDDLLL
jgi:hypothetical protein